MSRKRKTPAAGFAVANLPARIADQRRIEIASLLGGYFPRGQHRGARADRKILHNWNPLEQGADADNLGDLPTLRARSHDAFRGQPLATGAVYTFLDNVVGTGLVPHSRIDRRRLGLGDDAEAKARAADWQREADEKWDLYSCSTDSDITGRHTFATQQKVALASLILGGDFLIIRRWKSRGVEDSYRSAIQIIEAHRICTPDILVDGMPADKNRLIYGVETDANGEPVAFWVRNESPTGAYLNGKTWTRVPARDPSGRLQAVLISDPIRPGETRGVPLLAPVLEQLRGLSEYMDNEILASVLQSLLTFFLKTPAAGTNEFPSIGVAMDTTETQGATGGRETAAISLGNGQLAEGLPGEELEMLQPTRPNATVEAFFSAITTEIGAALGISSGLIRKKFDASYSASRGELQEANRRFMAMRGAFLRFTNLVRAWWLEEAVSRSLFPQPGDDPLLAIDAPRFFESRVIRAAWSYCTWSGPVVTSLDPRKEVDAARLAVDTGFMSRQTAAERLYGLDAQVEHDQLVTESEQRKAAGLDEVPDFASTSSTRSTSTAIQPGQSVKSEDDDDEGDDE